MHCPEEKDKVNKLLESRKGMTFHNMLTPPLQLLWSVNKCACCSKLDSKFNWVAIMTNPENTQYKIECSYCYLHTGVYSNIEETVSVWNTNMLLMS